MLKLAGKFCERLGIGYIYRSHRGRVITPSSLAGCGTVAIRLDRGIDISFHDTDYRLIRRGILVRAGFQRVLPTRGNEERSTRSALSTTLISSEVRLAKAIDPAQKRNDTCRFFSDLAESNLAILRGLRVRGCGFDRASIDRGSKGDSFSCIHDSRNAERFNLLSPREKGFRAIIGRCHFRKIEVNGCTLSDKLLQSFRSRSVQSRVLHSSVLSFTWVVSFVPRYFSIKSPPNVSIKREIGNKENAETEDENRGEKRLYESPFGNYFVSSASGAKKHLRSYVS